MQRRITNRWYDSVLTLSGREPSLDLQVRVYAHRYAPESGLEQAPWRDGHGHTHYTRIVDWGDEWYQWRESLKTVVENGWNRHLWLVPSNGPIPRPDNPNAAFPALACRLSLRLVSEGDNPHVKVDCRKLHPEDTFLRSSMGGPTMHCDEWERFARGIREAMRGQYEPNHGHLDSGDLVPKASGQIAAVHEFGHYLGLSHVACDSNATECYGQPGTWANGDMMGGGTRIEPWHGRPWHWRLGWHLVRWSRLYNWYVVAQRPPRQRPPDGGFRAPRRSPSLPIGGVDGLDGGVGALDGGV